MRPLNYPYFKFLGAVETLATSALPLQKRLEFAHTGFIAVKRDDFDAYPEIMAAYDDLYEAITKIKDPDAGYVPATTSRMTDEEAEAAADKLFTLYNLISRVYHSEE
ncbi:hypothetical protein [Methylobacterium sp. Leaf123]|uniref:hypothetical protein n=1 Tax=Methylobacterium sp. Leaf123 TaxID=1736264 RepID=UPI000A81F4AF|nr:hypothetical protein [Methylobacterium sp. Leaf123]